jgi:hypothetical protein
MLLYKYQNSKKLNLYFFFNIFFLKKKLELKREVIFNKKTFILFSTLWKMILIDNKENKIFSIYKKYINIIKKSYAFISYNNYINKNITEEVKKNNIFKLSEFIIKKYNYANNLFNINMSIKNIDYLVDFYLNNIEYENDMYLDYLKENNYYILLYYYIILKKENYDTYYYNCLKILILSKNTYVLKLFNNKEITFDILLNNLYIYNYYYKFQNFYFNNNYINYISFFNDLEFNNNEDEKEKENEQKKNDDNNNILEDTTLSFLKERLIEYDNITIKKKLRYLNIFLSDKKMNFFLSDEKGNTLFRKNPGTYGFKHLKKRKNNVLSYVLEQNLYSIFNKKNKDNFLNYNYYIIFNNLNSYFIFQHLKLILTNIWSRFFYYINFFGFYLKNNINWNTFKKKKRPRI